MPIPAAILTQLADILAEIYSDHTSARTLASSAGLRVERIAFDAKPVNYWAAVLEEAEAYGATQALLDRASAQYPNHTGLATVAQAYLAWRLPALPPQDLPDKPYRYLDRYHRADAEIFFGRGREIRELVELITAADSPPIVPLYGQSGVGKSSLLEAGLQPRLEGRYVVYYLRRDQGQGLLGTITAGLGAAPGDNLATTWHHLETQNVKALLVILDQVEEVYTRTNVQQPDELADFLDALGVLFADAGRRPRGRLILSFRKEWLAEINRQLDDHRLPHGKGVFLERLGRAGIAEVVAGPQSSPRLRSHFGLSVTATLPGLIADDLLADRESPVAPMLAILLTDMWTAAKTLDYDHPQFDEDLYHEFHRRGLSLDDFLSRQLGALHDKLPEAVDSGLALDLLAHHTTPLGTAEQRTLAELEQTYGHRQDVLPTLVQECRDLYLLVDPSRNQPDHPPASRLTHDTLAPHVRKRFDESDQPGQRARRILESRAVDWQEGKTGAPLDSADLAIVEAGQAGMRSWDTHEEALVLASQVERTRRQEEAERSAQAREQARQRELDQARQLAEEQRLRVEEGERAARGLRKRLIAATAAVAIAVIALVIAVAFGADNRTQRDRAERALATTTVAQGQAEVEAENAQSAQATAEASAAEAQQQRYMAEQRQQEAEARSLAVQAERLNSADPALALLLASEAARQSLRTGEEPPVEVAATLHRLLATPHVSLLRDVNAHDAHVWSIAFWPDETKFVTVGCDQRLSTGACLSGQARVWDASGALLAEFGQRPNDIVLASVSPAGEQILTADAKGVVQLWDATELREITTLPGYSSTLTSAIFSSDGKRILTVGEQKPTRLWSATGQLLTTLDTEGLDISNALFSPDGTRIASSHCATPGGSESCSTGYVRLWDIDGNLVTEFARGTGVRRVSFGPGGTMLTAECAELAGDRCVEDMVRLWDHEGQLLETLEGKRFLDPLRHVGFNASGTRILALSNNAGALWTITGQLLATFEAQSKHFFPAAGFTPNGELFYVVSAGSDPLSFDLFSSKIQLWDADGQLLTTLPGKTQGILRAVAVKRDNSQLWAAGLDGRLKIWDTDQVAGKLQTQLGTHKGFVRNVNYSPQGDRFITAAEDGFRLWDAVGELMAHLETRAAVVYAARFNRQGTQFATFVCDAERVAGECDKEAMRLWDANGKFVRDVTNYRFGGGFDFAPAEGRLVIAGESNTALIQGSDGQTIAVLTGHTGPVNRIAYSEDGSRIGTSSDDGTVRIWDADGKQLMTLSGHTGATRGVRFSEATGDILTYGDDGSVRLWSAAGELRHILDGHPGGVKFATFNQAGNRVLVESNKGPVRLWDSEGNIRAVIGENAQWVDVATFDPAGERILTVECNAVNEGDWCIRHSVNLWNTQGAQLATVDNHWVTWAAFHPAGGQIATAGCDTFDPVINNQCLVGGVWLWRDFVDTEALASEAATRAGRFLTAVECQQYLGQAQCP